MAITRAQRNLTSSEQRLVTSGVRRCRAERRGALRRALLVSAILSSVLCGVTLLASSAPRVVIVGFWCVIGFVLAAWVALDARRASGKRLIALEGALRARRADTVRITASRYIEFQEVSDEGACYAFETGPEEVVFVSGQDFYASPRFPTGDFTLVAILSDTGDVVHGLIEKSGLKLAPIRVISAARKSMLRVPSHLALVNTTLEALEEALAA